MTHATQHVRLTQHAALQDAGHHAMAYVTAKSHGLEEEAAHLAETLGTELPEVRSDAALMMPPTPIVRESNWPLLTVTKGLFEGKFDVESAGAAAAMDTAMDDLDLGGGWGDDLDLGGTGGAGDAEGGEDALEAQGSGGWDMEVRALLCARVWPISAHAVGRNFSVEYGRYIVPPSWV